MSTRVQKFDLKISTALHNLVTNKIIPGTGIEPEHFWKQLAKIINDLGPKNRALLAKREQLQQQINTWHLEHKGQTFDINQYQQFLKDIHYIVPEGDDFQITTTNVDNEIADIAGPQLVVPINNARFALNATNARWGSLYDALYGTNIIAETDGAEKGKAYNQVRGAKVVAWANEFLDDVVPLSNGSHKEVSEYRLIDQQAQKVLTATLTNGQSTSLLRAEQFVAYNDSSELKSILLCNNHLHIEIQIDRSHPIGKYTKSGIKDVILESAISVIQDCEDSVVAVDAEDKAIVYKNWLELMQGTLEESFQKNGTTITRKLNADREYITADGSNLTLPGRSLLLVRNVGSLMTTDAVLDQHDQEISEAILDAMVTSLCAIHDLNKPKNRRNSRAGSIYIVKPKMHGPEEVAFTNELFSRVEEALGLPVNTIKVGVMDEERRTTVNLKECIRAVSERVVFINTGFLDRTGDEIHTSMEMGAVAPKEAIKSQPWYCAYENQNVDIGLKSGFRGKAQIGKGMWTKPNDMQQMLHTKQEHPQAGANCAWVPSPTAATLHVIHYHKINVQQRQQELATRKHIKLTDILTPPLLRKQLISQDEIQRELDNNIQGILGYVVRWVDQGIGCSKVSDINGVGLMEDRATLRVSSQHVANWLHHNICTIQQVNETLKRMAKTVDQQNSTDPHYKKMAPDFENSIAFKAACDLIFLGTQQASGYTDLILSSRRREIKSSFINHHVP